MKDRDITQEASGNDGNPHSETEFPSFTRSPFREGVIKVCYAEVIQGRKAMRKVRDYFKGTELKEDPDAFTIERQRLGKSSLARCRRKTKQSRKRQRADRKLLEAELANWKPEMSLIKKSEQ
jgi:hypothetical protein